MVSLDLVKLVSLHGCLLIAVVIFLIPFLAIIGYRKIRPKFPVTVECWFCQKKSKVPYGNRNCWDCLSCEQYNGFKDDGDYNKPIPAQYDENLNFPIMGESPKGKKQSKFGSNGLCAQCNSNQVVKMRMISSFVSINTEREDEEYRNYINHLDKLYSFCWRCDIHTQKFLSKQDDLLRNSLPPSYYRNSSNIDPLPSKSFNLPKATYIFLAISLLSLIPLLIQAINEFQQAKQRIYVEIPSSLIENLPQNHISLFVGFISTTLVVGLIGKERWHINDALLTFFWVTLQVLYSEELISQDLYHGYVIYAQPLMIIFIGVFSLVAYCFKMKQISKSQRNRITTFKLQKSELGPSYGKDIYANVLDESFSTDEDGDRDELFPLDASLNAVHITPPNEKKVCYQGDIGYEFEISHLRKRSYPVLRPARFNPRSITHSSWVAGGFWSLPNEYNPEITSKERTAMNYAAAGYQTSGLFTPPPSVTGSQQSRATSAADWQTNSATSVRSWPPSFYSEKMSKTTYTPSSYEPPLTRVPNWQGSQAMSSVSTMTAVPAPKSRIWIKILISLCITCSVIGNFLFLNYYFSWPFASSFHGFFKQSLKIKN